MKRTIKVMIGLCCLLIGCILSTQAEDLRTDFDYNGILQVLGFALMMIGGLYSFLKIATTLIYES